MATYSIELLSGSTNGKAIKVAATSTPGTTIHTAVSGTTDLDLVTLYAYNHHTANVALTLEWGGTSSPDDIVQVTVPYKAGPILLCEKRPLQNGLAIAAFAGTTNVVTIFGIVHRADK